MSPANENRKFAPLNSDNYFTWKVRAKAKLIKEKAWMAILGKETDGDKNLAAYSELVLLVDEGQYHIFGDEENPKKVWDELKKWHVGTVMSSKLDLQKQLNRMVWKNGTIEEHIQEMQGLLGKLALAGDKKTDQEIVNYLVGSLPETDDYRTLIITIESKPEKEVTMDYVARKVKQISRRTEDDSNEKNVGMKAENQNTATIIECYQCHKMGHYARDCRGSSGGKFKPGKFQGKCFKCHKVGHRSNECRGKATSGGGANFRNSEDVGLALMATEKHGNDLQVIIDSGASKHFAGVEFVENVKQVATPFEVKGINGTTVVSQVGTVSLNGIGSDSKLVKITVSEVHVIPGLGNSMLLSVSKLKAKLIYPDFQTLWLKEIDGKKLLKITERGDTYELALAKVKVKGWLAANQRKTLQEYHRSFGHLNFKEVKKILENDSISFEDDGTGCNSCVAGKMIKGPNKNTGTTTEEALDMIHSDLCGPITPATLGGKRYFVTFIDDATDMTFIELLKQKNETLDKYKEKQIEFKTQYGKEIKILKSDNGGEYVSNKFSNLLIGAGTRHETTVPHTPQQNGKAERFNRTIVEGIKTLLKDTKLPKTFWGEAASYMVMTRNNLPRERLEWKTPAEVFQYRLRLSLDTMIPFGTKILYFVAVKQRKKLDNNGQEGVFLGYHDTTKGYRVLTFLNKVIIVSKIVRMIQEKCDENEDVEEQDDWSEMDSSSEESGREEELEVFLTPNLEVDTEGEATDESTEGEATYESAESEVFDESESDKSEASLLRTPRTLRTQKMTKGIAAINEKHVTWDEDQWNNLENVNLPKRGNRGAMAYAALIQDPRTLQEALDSKEKEFWVDAIRKEVTSLEDQNTIEIVDIPKGSNIVKCKFVFKTKQSADGEIERYKTRLVACGYSQAEGIDYNETFSPVVAFESVRTLLVLACLEGMEVSGFDVDTAFLIPELKEEVYMRIPAGLENIVDTFHGINTKVRCIRLRKSLYGLKQASHDWNLHFDTNMKSLGWIRLKSEGCIYTKREKGELLLLSIYVDDGMIFGKQHSLRDEEITKIAGKYGIKQLGLAKWIVQVKLERFEGGGFFLSQELYCRKILERFQMEDCNGVQTPMEGEVLARGEDEERADNNLYRRAVASLIYLAEYTRPDLKYAVGRLSQFMNDPSEEQWKQVKRVLRYIQQTKEYGLMIKPKQGDLIIECYTDSDWCSDRNDRKSVSGVVIFLNGVAVMWKSKKQQVTALSSFEAELYAAVLGMQQVLHLKTLIEELGFKVKKIILLLDNRSSKLWITRRQNTPRSKHIDIKNHFIRELYERGFMVIQHVSTQDQVADCMTKALGKNLFTKFRNILGVENKGGC